MLTTIFFLDAMDVNLPALVNIFLAHLAICDLNAIRLHRKFGTDIIGQKFGALRKDDGVILLEDF